MATKDEKPEAKKPADTKPAGKKYPADPTVGEFRSTTEVKTAIIPGVTFRSKAVQYCEIDGIAIFEGDIELGPAQQVESTTATLRSAASDPSGMVAHAVLITGQQFRWPNCRIPYDIDAALPNQNRVTDAIAHWEANTRFRFVLRTPANAAQFPDYVTFITGSGCSSAVGKRGGQQFVRLAAGCSTGNAIHEVGHVVGLWHEQSREDRDQFVTIQWANIIPGMAFNFDQHIADGDDVGAYDYGSIMHYPRDAFSVNGQDTIVPTQPGAQIGQRNGLSAGDIAAANSLCPVATLKFIDDPAPTLKFRDDVPPPTLKFRDDFPPPTLKFRDDAPPPTLKFRDDFPPTLKFRDDGPPPTLKFRDDIGPTLKFRDDAGPRLPGPGVPQVGPQPGIAAPFVLGMPHHSMAWMQTFPEAYQAQIAQLEAELNRVYEQLTQYSQADEQGALTDADRAQGDALYQEFSALLQEYESLTGYRMT